MQITGSPISTAQLAKTPIGGSIAAANRASTGNLGAVNAESGATASGGGGLSVDQGQGGMVAQGTRPRRGHTDPHLGQNVDMWV